MYKVINNAKNHYLNIDKTHKFVICKVYFSLSTDLDNNFVAVGYFCG